jgi:hypothetical protein
MPGTGTTWLAYRIKGNQFEKYDGVIRADSREEAEVITARNGARTPSRRHR